MATNNLAAKIRANRRRADLIPLPPSALTDIMGVKVSGWLAAYIWKMVYLYELGHNMNRARVLVDWTIDLLSRPDTSKLYEEDG